MTRHLPSLSKTRIQNGRQCHKRLWLDVHQRELAEWGKASQLRLAQGTAFGELAQALLGGGHLVEADYTESREAQAETQRLLARPRARVPQIFEAAFEHQRVRVRVDVLRREPRSDTLIEVKSTTGAKAEHIWDAAIQTWVLRGAGRPVKRVQIGHLNKDFVYQREGDYEGLLALTDITDQVDALQPEIPALVRQLKKVVQGPMPEITTGAHCSSPYDCPFIGHCQSMEPPQPEFPVTLLPHGGKSVEALLAEGYRDLRDVPEDRFDNPRHQRIAEATRTGKPFVDPALRKAIKALPWPRYFLDFEAISFPVPRWLRTRPFQQIAFQFSCHVQTSARAKPRHHGYLDTEDSHPEARVAKRLVECIGDTGPILVWNRAFEAQILRQMAEAQPKLRKRLLAMIDRLVDLLPLYREHYYHAEQRGSWSLKAVLPTVAPELAYEGLEVANGLDAQVAYLQLLGDEARSQESDLAAALGRYCAMDTAALVLLGVSSTS